MKWFISHQSSLDFWRTARAEKALSGKRARACTPAAKPLNTKRLAKENPCGLALPLHILVGGDNARKVSKRIKSHICSLRLPSGSFIQVTPDVAVSSPELCFLQMAGVLPLIETIMLGYELCGSYRLDKRNEPDRGFRDDLPLTSVAKLGSYLAKAIGLKGRKNALRALRHIADNSASPMETTLSMLLTLPYRLGGYGFTMPRLNSPVNAMVSARKATRQSSYYCDLYWPDKRVAVEYDSDAFHTGSDRIAKDAVRRNALLSAGVSVIVVSRKQVISTSLLRKTAKILAKLLGKRLKYPLSEFYAHHSSLQRLLLPGYQ